MRRITVSARRMSGTQRVPSRHRAQDRLTRLWKRVGGGCYLKRPIAALLEEAGLRVEQIETGYMKGPS
jgi:hypothetical protein